MKRIIAAWLAVILLALPMIGQAAASPVEMIRALWNPDKSVMWEITWEVSELPDSLLNLPEVEVAGSEELTEQVSGMVKGLTELMNALSVTGTLNPAMDRAELDVRLNGNTVFGAGIGIDGEGLAVNTDWIAKAPVRFSWDEVKSAADADFDVKALIDGLTALTTQTVAFDWTNENAWRTQFPNTMAWLETAQERMTRLPVEEQPEGCDEAAAVLRSQSTPEDAAGELDAILADLRLQPTLMRLLESALAPSGKTADQLFSEMKSGIAETMAKQEVNAVYWVDAENRAVHLEMDFTQKPEDGAEAENQMSGRYVMNRLTDSDGMHVTVEGSIISGGVTTNNRVELCLGAARDTAALINSEIAEDGAERPVLRLEAERLKDRTDAGFTDVLTLQEQMWLPEYSYDRLADRIMFSYPEEPTVVLSNRTTVRGEWIGEGPVITVTEETFQPGDEKPLTVMRSRVTSGKRLSPMDLTGALVPAAMSPEEKASFERGMNMRVSIGMIRAMQQMPEDTLNLVMLFRGLFSE